MRTNFDIPHHDMGPNDDDVRDYIFSHSSDNDWKDAPEALKWATAGKDRSILLPFFENECGKAYSPENHKLKELRKLTHYIETSIGVQTNLPKETIVALMCNEAGREKFESTVAKQDDDFINNQAESWKEDIGSYKNNGNLEAALHRIEIMAQKTDADIARIMFLPRIETNLKKTESLKEKMETIRAARSTLLEEYFSPGSLH
jgi:hypothetical protein